MSHVADRRLDVRSAADHTRVRNRLRVEEGAVSARYRIRVDQTLCQGSGVCAGIAPDHFEVGEDYRSRPIHEVVDANELVIDAAECCPLEAIIVTDADTGERVQ